jgi:hypothetical protein
MSLFIDLYCFLIEMCVLLQEIQLFPRELDCPTLALPVTHACSLQSVLEFLNNLWGLGTE